MASRLKITLVRSPIGAPWRQRRTVAALGLRKMNQSGLLPLVYAHLFSLSQMRDVFSRQVRQGKAPAGIPRPAPATV